MLIAEIQLAMLDGIKGGNIPLGNWCWKLPYLVWPAFFIAKFSCSPRHHILLYTILILT